MQTHIHMSIQPTDMHAHTCVGTYIPPIHSKYSQLEMREGTGASQEVLLKNFPDVNGALLRS